ncbi:MAG: hypothetical protein QM723_27060 [Myxococcaceae bacterium]
MRRLSLLAVGWTLLLAQTARCETPEWATPEEKRAYEAKEAVKPYEPPPEPAPYQASQHFEAAFGFMGGQRDLGHNSYQFTPRAAQRVLAPLTTDPYNQLPVAGIDWELRMVVSDLRMAVGAQKPFAGIAYDPVQFVDVTDNAMHTLTPRSLSMWDVRFGLGYEHRFKALTPFIDLVGDVQSIHSDLIIDGQQKSYGEWTFAFSVRAGFRFYLPHYMFIAPSVEVGVYGPSRWAATIQTGWQVPMNFD